MNVGPQTFIRRHLEVKLMRGYTKYSQKEMRLTLTRKQSPFTPGILTN